MARSGRERIVTVISLVVSLVLAMGLVPAAAFAEATGVTGSSNGVIVTTLDTNQHGTTGEWAASEDVQDSAITPLVPSANESAEGATIYRAESGGSLGYKKAQLSSWATLQNALAAGGTVALAEDIEYDGSSGPLVVPAGKEAVLDLNGHSIDCKQAYNKVITVESGGKLTLEDTTGGGKITGGNNEANGCGVLVDGTLVMNGGAIVDNGAGNPGVMVDNGTFTLNGGSISGYEGVFNGGTFTMTGGTVNGTTDGVYLNLDSVFTLSGGTISGGNGVNYVDGVFNLSGNPTISATGHSVFLFPNRLINITGALSNETPISVEHMYDMDVFTSGYSEHNSDDPSKWFTNEKHTISLTADGREAQIGYSVTCKRAQHGAVGADKSMVDAGDVVTLSVKPDEGYELDTLTVTCGGKSVEVKDNAFTMPAGNVTVSATFKAVQHTVTYQVKSGTWADGSTADKTEKVDHGASPAAVPIGMKASTGYGNGAWDKDPSGAVVTADATFVYSFTPNEYTVKFVNEDGTVLQNGQMAYGETPVYKGQEPTKAEDSQYTYAFKGWTPEIAPVTDDITYTATYSKTAKAKAEYKAVSGKGSTWTKGSGKALAFTFEREGDDAATFAHFTGIQVDGKAVTEKDSSGKANWTAKKGSVIVELQPAYLETLASGKHTLTALFDDGDPVSVEFTVAEKKKESSSTSSKGASSAANSSSGKSSTTAKTADPTVTGTTVALALAAASALLLALARRRTPSQN